MRLGPAVAAVGVGIVLWRLFLILRERVRAEPGFRRALLIRGTVAIVAALAIGLAVPRIVPDTPGSPAALVFLLFGWMVAAMLGLLGIVATVAASVG